MDQKVEKFVPDEKQDDVTKIKGKYYRNSNENPCDAAKVYTGQAYSNGKDEVTFSLYEKYSAPWDNSMAVSYSIGWKTSKGDFLLGLPTQEKDIIALKKIVDKLASPYLSK